MKPPARTTPQLATTPHGFFGRAGGVSKGIYAGLNVGIGSDDAPKDVTENRRRCTHALGAKALVTAHQTHSSIARWVDAPWHKDQPRPKADALVTDQPGLAIGVLAADCVPILFASDGLVGCAHAGWRGSLDGIIEATIALMDANGAPPQSIRCAIGPSLNAPLFEVGDDLVKSACDVFAEATQFFTPREQAGKYTYNHIGFVCWRLEQTGIDPSHIHNVGGNTLAAPQDYFSYRASRAAGIADYGRNLSAIMLPRG